MVAISFVAFIVATAWIPVMCGWLMIEGLSRGVVRAQSGAYSRAKDTVWFWIVIASYAGVILGFCYLYVTIGRLLFARS